MTAEQRPEPATTPEPVAYVYPSRTDREHGAHVVSVHQADRTDDAGNLLEYTTCVCPGSEFTRSGMGCWAQQDVVARRALDRVITRLGLDRATITSALEARARRNG